MSTTESGLRMALQTDIPLMDETINPLLDIRSARRELRGYDEDQILMLVRNGYLEWAFDISNGDHDRRMELRILPACVENFKASGGRTKLAWDWERVTKELLKGWSKPWIPGTRAKLILNCSSTQLIEFIPLQLKLMPGTSYKPGPNGTPQITVESFLQFLKKRRVK